MGAIRHALPVSGWGAFVVPARYFMPLPPRWTALPATLDVLLARMVDVQCYPEVSGDGRAQCAMRIRTDFAPDPHDWRLWRTGTFAASYLNRTQLWRLRLRRCTACRGIEVREERWRPYMPSIRSRRRVSYQPSREEELLGYYRGGS